MTRLQFWILNSLGGLILITFILHIVVVNMAQASQVNVVSAQQFIRQGQVYDARVRQLATRIYQVGQQTQDQALKDIVTREGFQVNPAPADTSAPEPTPAPTH